MDASLFIRQPNANSYSDLGSKTFSVLPRKDEFISAKHDGGVKYFEVIAIHHNTEKQGAVTIYAIETEPSWEVRKSRTIGFGPGAH